uniref:CARD domain-containing protein n=1 Tax=Plectus sambesii TaxID=2011161 RepID=A0A914XDD5_9BILA
MNQEHRDLIIKCRARLVTSIAKSRSLDVLIDHLRSSDQNGDDGITEGNILRIRGGDHTDSAAKVNIFFDILTEKSEIAFHRFINAIIDSGETGLIDILNSKLPSDQKISKQRTAVPATASASISSSTCD